MFEIVMEIRRLLMLFATSKKLETSFYFEFVNLIVTSGILPVLK